MARFGIEEEFTLLDPATLAPTQGGPEARDALQGRPGLGAVATEFLTCQIEHATSPMPDRESARRELTSFRRALTAHSAARGALATAVGTPFGTGEDATVSPSARYRAIADWLGDIVGGHQVSGMHVHTEITDGEERVRALNALRPWLPVLLALSGNSPFWHGRDTGYASWRTILMRRLPTMGCPPFFHDETDYRTTVDRLIGLTVLPDAASVSWVARLSERFPTVEVRVFDVQLSVDDALLQALLTRASLTTIQPSVIRHDTKTIDASLWVAARGGLDATLPHPVSGDPVGARRATEELFATLAPTLEESGDLAFVAEHISRVLHEGTGATRQRRAFADAGIAGLRALCDDAAGAETGDDTETQRTA